MNKKGFTLIELLVVIAIIGLLSTLAVVALGSARSKARDSKRLSDIKQVQTALELYYTDQGSYPVDTITALGAGEAVCLDATGFAATCTDAYMGLVPADPQYDSDVDDSPAYTYTSDGTTYEITAALEGNINGIEGTITATPSGITGSGSAAE